MYLCVKSAYMNSSSSTCYCLLKFRIANFPFVLSLGIREAWIIPLIPSNGYAFNSGMKINTVWTPLINVHTSYYPYTHTYTVHSYRPMYTHANVHTYTHIHLHTYAYTHDCQHPHTIEAVCRICDCKLITKIRPDYKCLIYHLISNYMTNPLHLMNRKLM